MTDVFISYSRKDKEFMRRLHTALAAIERDVWVDWEDIPLTADWWKEISNGIEAANTFVFVISPDSVRSSVCRNEITHAVTNNKRFVPILLRPIIEPGDQEAMHPAISSHNWIYFQDDTEFDVPFKALIEAIDTDLSHVREHTRLLVRAKEWEERGRGNVGLLSGGEILEAEHWLKASSTKSPAPSPLHTEYIAASRRALTTRRGLTIGGILISAVIAFLAYFGFNQAQIAQNEANRAATAQVRAEVNASTAQAAANANATAQAVAIEAQTAAEREAQVAQSRFLAGGGGAQDALDRGDVMLALRLALEANSIADPPIQAQRVLADAAYQPGVQRLFAGHSDSVLSVAFTPDGRFAVSGSADKTLMVWEVATGRILRRFEGQTDAISSVAVSPDGTLALSGSFDGTLALWDLATGELLRQLVGHTNSVYSVAFSPDGRYAVSGSADNTLRLWDVRRGIVIRVFVGQVDTISSVAVSPDARQVLSGSADNTIILWDVETGRELHQFEGHTDSIYSVAFSPDGIQFLSGSADNTLILWDAATGAEIRRFEGHTGPVVSVALTSDGTRALSGSLDKSIIVWDIHTGQILQNLIGHTDQVRSVVASPDGRYILSGSDDTQIFLWDIAPSGAEIRRFEGHAGGVLSVAISPDGTQLLSGEECTTTSRAGRCFAGEAILWDANTGAEIRRLNPNLLSDKETVSRVAFSADGKWLLLAGCIEHPQSTASRNPCIRGGALVHATTWQGNAEPLAFGEYDAPVITAAFSPDSQQILLGAGANVSLWSLDSGDKVLTLSGNTEGTFDAAFSPDGRFVATGGCGGRDIRDNCVQGEIVLWDADSGDEIRRLTSDSLVRAVNALTFSPDGKMLMSANADNTLMSWDLDSGTLINIYTGHNDIVTSVAFSPDGTRMVSGSADRMAILWDVATASVLTQFGGHMDRVTSVAFSPDGKFALSGSMDNALRTWRIDTLSELMDWARTNRFVRELTCTERANFNIQPLCESP
ncbi:MAG: TIR domain-containing protein [Anaerolineae bacterium]|nr:TIR domain-containing protein [Anaerolineae bacterium]